MPLPTAAPHQPAAHRLAGPLPPSQHVQAAVSTHCRCSLSVHHIGALSAPHRSSCTTTPALPAYIQSTALASSSSTRWARSAAPAHRPEALLPATHCALRTSCSATPAATAVAAADSRLPPPLPPTPPPPAAYLSLGCAPGVGTSSRGEPRALPGTACGIMLRTATNTPNLSGAAK